jgi:hypothetical protein
MDFIYSPHYLFSEQNQTQKVDLKEESSGLFEEIDDLRVRKGSSRCV